MAIEERFGNFNSVLLLAPPMSEVDKDSCFRLSTLHSPSKQKICCIEFTLPVERVLDQWNRGEHRFPAEMIIIRIGVPAHTRETTRQVTIAGEEITEYGFATVSDPGSLVRMGGRIERILDGWAEGPHQIVLCMNSITSFLQYVNAKQAFRFLNVLIGQLYEVDAIAHFHMDPDAHDPSVVNTLKQLFECTVQVNPDGDLELLQYR